MKYLGAYMLAVLGGKLSPGQDDITKILESVGVEVDDETLGRVLKELEGKDVFEVMASGKEKLAAVPAGGAVAAAAGGGGAQAPEEGAEQKEEEKEESEEEEEEELGFDLFD